MRNSKMKKFGVSAVVLGCLSAYGPHATATELEERASAISQCSTETLAISYTFGTEEQRRILDLGITPGSSTYKQMQDNVYALCDTAAERAAVTKLFEASKEAIAELFPELAE